VDREIRFWRAEAEPEREVWADRGVPVGFSADSRTLITADANRRLRFWDSQRDLSNTQQDHEPERRASLGRPSDARRSEAVALELPPASMTNFNNRAISSDGRQLAVVLTNGAVQVWDLQKRQLKETLAGDTSALNTLTFSGNGRFLAAADWKKLGATSSGTVHVWDLETRRAKFFRFESTTTILRFPAVALSPDGKVLATASTESRAKFSDVRTQTELSNVAGTKGDLLSLAFSPDGRLLAGGYRETVCLWDVPTGQVRAVLKSRNENGVSQVAFSPDGKLVITSGADGRVELWNIASGRVVLTVRSPLHLAVRAFFSPDGNTLVVASRSGPMLKPFVRVLQADSLEQIDAVIGGSAKSP